MFKKITVAVLALGFVSVAQAQRSNMVDRIYQQNDRVHAAVRDNAHRLDPQTQRQVLEQLRSLEATLLRGGPQPGRPPQPPPGGPYNYSFRGEIDGHTFDFIVRDLPDLYTQCGSFLDSKNLQKANSIKVSTNFGAIQKLIAPNYYWVGTPDICMELNEVATKAGLTYQGFEAVYLGTIEGHEFLFQSNSVIDTNRQCEDFVKSKGIQKVNKMKISLNYQPLKTLIAPNYYWVNSFEICQQIVQLR